MSAPLFLGDAEGGGGGGGDESIDITMDAAGPVLEPSLELDPALLSQDESLKAAGLDPEAAPVPTDAAPTSLYRDSSPAFSVPLDSAPSSSQTDLPPDSELVTSLPVYLSNSLLDTSSLHLFQYPIYPRDRPLPVPLSAASRGLKVTSRWRPKTNRVEVELPLDVREEVYNLDKGADFGVGAEMVRAKQKKIEAAFQGADAAAAAASGGSSASAATAAKVKREKQEEERMVRERGPGRLDKTRLDSVQVPSLTNYMVGVIRDQALHLTPLSSVVQLRPSMHYLDALDEAREAEKRRDRAAAAGEANSDSDDEDDLIEMEAPGPGSTRKKASAPRKKDERKPNAQTLSVAMRGDPNAPKGAPGAMGGTSSEGRDQLMAAQREADAERWIELEWRDEESEEAGAAFRSQMFAGTRRRLACQTRPREYLVEVE